MNDKNEKAPIAPFNNSSFEIVNGKASLTIDSAEDRIAIYGSLDITATKDGLDKAKELADYLNQVIRHLELLEHMGKLPAEEVIKAPVMKDNPFMAH